ncbi:PaaI family thioesterase [Actinomadura sp. LD22]|uniref:PaaI family thioesterase n=1 Tax=Actinomadura physcomitrii TaxID=2650748 RepID=A0A6I4M8X0_9ACTN|nr:PaaI family thioesterase [Actinomadura physcomitrii]MWA00855.1 PaaI family thioesterase [Actinomadura physcomitrii]
MIESLRLLHDRITGAAPPPELLKEMTRAFEDLAVELGRYAVPEREQITGHRIDLPGRGQALVPVFTVDESDDEHVQGSVRFGRYYLGGNGAAHGGAIPLVFDEMLGRLANAGGRPISRTAYLRVDYRSITPLDRDLHAEAWFDREEGRKRFLRGVILDGETLCAEAEGLFVALKPGQP